LNICFNENDEWSVMFSLQFDLQMLYLIHANLDPSVAIVAWRCSAHLHMSSLVYFFTITTVNACNTVRRELHTSSVSFRAFIASAAGLCRPCSDKFVIDRLAFIILFSNLNLIVQCYTIVFT
jgi:hypothetical protein